MNDVGPVVLEPGEESDGEVVTINDGLVVVRN